MKSQGTLTNIEENDFRINVLIFLLALLRQLKQRLQENMKILKDLSYFSANYVLQSVKDASTICNVMKFLGINENTVAKADYQLQKINLVDGSTKRTQKSFRVK